MQTYRHSGTLGDLIYSLSILKKMPAGRFLVALNNIENVIRRYNYGDIDPAHRGRFTLQDFAWLEPLLKRQSYIREVDTWSVGDVEPTVDLDLFRGTLFRGFEGNYVEAYHRAFQLPFTQADYNTTWLEADPVETRPIVVSRTARYRSPSPASDQQHRQMAQDSDLANNGIFVGTEAEYLDYVKVTGVNIPYHQVADFLELANIVAGAELVVANQNFVYSLAMGLGISTILETIKIKPLQNNECYFPRENCQYF